MRGELHKRIVAVLAERIDGVHITQESLAKRLGMHQTTISGILKKDAGTLDLDEAAAALEHVDYGTLADFAKGLPAPAPRDEAKLVAALMVRPELVDFIKDLLPVPKPRLGEVLELARGIARLPIVRRGGRRGGSSGGSQPAPRTKSAPGRRRSARRGKQRND